MRTGFPKACKGMVIGLLGGSFDPAHRGHVHITREALKRMRLNRVWWLVSSGNPLKEHVPAPSVDRMARARLLMRDPRVVVTDLEVRLGTVRTVDTLAQLQALYPGVRFVWLMGADNLVQFHRWERWQEILWRVPVGVLARPGWSVRGRTSKAARVFSGERVGRGEALRLRGAPAWCFVNLPMDGSSSSEIRARGNWRP
ncbi:MAG: nicotinate-nucleotide adenylyltransferase [Rhodobacteraceae bacterium]|nr:nicotinate-nucleotide adenylyltransferase [Paracoccaceae bacterium]